MDHFHLLEVIASEVFTSNAMARHNRTAHYLSALATLSQALARRQHALSEIERHAELLDRTADHVMRGFLDTQRQQAERNQVLAELELRGIELWINTLSGGFVGKDQLSKAFGGLAEEAAGATFDRIFASDEDIEEIIARLGANQTLWGKPDAA